MSVKATERAWASGAGGNDLLVLLALADFAGGQDDPYDYAYPAVATIASMTRVSPRTVQRCLRSLEAVGHVRATGEYTWGRGKVTTQYRIERVGGVNSPGRHPDAPSDEAQGGDTVVSPNPSSNPPRKKNDAGAGARQDEFPEDLDPSLHEVAIAAGKILKRTATTRGQQRPVTRGAVGHAIASYAGRDFVQTARELEAWLLHGKGASRPCADIVARYRNFLSRADFAAGPPLPRGVTPMHGRRSGRESAGDLIDDIMGGHGA